MDRGEEKNDGRREDNGKELQGMMIRNSPRLTTERVENKNLYLWKNISWKSIKRSGRRPLGMNLFFERKIAGNGSWKFTKSGFF